MNRDLSWVINNYQQTVFKIAYTYLKSPSDADDVVQDVFLQYYKSEKEFENDQHIRNWLITVTINRCKKHFILPYIKNCVNIDDYVSSLSYVSKEEGELIHTVMKLPVKYRRVIHLYYYEDYPIKEIAQMLKIKETTVQTQLARARSKLKNLLEE